MTLYLDAVWTMNLLLDFMLLLLTSAITKINTSKKRMVFGAFIASLIVPLTIYYPDMLLNTVYGKLTYSLLIIFCTFHIRSIAGALKLLGTFYFVSFAVGGGLFAFHFMLESSITISSVGILTVNKGYGDPISWIFVMVGFPISLYFTKRRLDKHANEKIRYDQLHEVTLTMNKMSFHTTGYIDSGNQLVCPLTKKPVVICDQAFLIQWFSEEEWEQLKKAHEQLSFETMPENWIDKINIVPYQGVEGNSNFLLALQPEELYIKYEQREIKANNVLIGIQFGNLTEDYLYHCLLHPQIIKLATVQTA